MSIPKITKRKANGVGMGILLVGLGILMYLNTWWPEIMLVIGVSLSVKQYLRGRLYDIIVTIFVCGGTYVYYKTPVPWDILMPILFVVGGIYVISREIFFPTWREGEEEVEDVRLEIENGRKNEE